MPTELHPDANAMSALLGGELQGAARRALLTHLSQCPECRQWAGESQTALGMVMPQAVSAPSHRTWAFYALPAAAGLALAAALWLRPALPVTAPSRPVAAAPARTSTGAPLAPARPTLAVLTPARHPQPAAPGVLVVPAPATRAAALTSLAALPAPSVPTGEFQPSIDFSPLMTGFQDQPLENAAEVQFAHQVLAGTIATPVAAASPDSAVLATPYAQGFVTAAPRHRQLSGPYAPRATPSLDGALGWTVSRSGAVLHSVGAGIWAAIPLVPGLHIRAVFASGAHIWAGADAGQVFASADRGAHWRHLLLPEPHPHATHVASIEFTDARHGVVRLDNGHLWQTSDGGTTWTAGQ